ncbi:hypothetical protein DVH24_039148 [Malus domestica]|uniref:Uncharacterized protein n=1 Tax=Malus domestica TaxID=3750 RepID=A0A498KEQ0_MALDO|nr:hypothetical protein DVH24_039148 [Malus domestica]
MKMRGDDLLSIVKEVSWDMLYLLSSRLPPLGLEKLHIAMSWNFNDAWRNLLKLWWPKLDIGIEPLDWQQIYWEMHLQKGRGRPRKTLEEALRKDLEYLDITEDMIQNRAQWCSRIHIADPT